VEEQRSANNFDVVCAGDALWRLAAPKGPSTKGLPSMRLRPGGGAVDVALALAREGLRVGLATVRTDDKFGRARYEQIAASGVDVGGVVLSRPRSGFVLVDASGGANQTPADVEEQPPLEVPDGWTSELLLLSGLSPVVSHAAALCKAARAARRKGTLVLLDFNASLHLWAGRDPRTIRMVLRELDAARCSLADLAVVGLDVEAVRPLLKQSAVLVVSDGAGGAVANGPFGEVAVAPAAEVRRANDSGDAVTAALCVELTRRGEVGESPGARWHRALQRGYAMASMRPWAMRSRVGMTELLGK
jgi:2-dehydro-3-deoxygluconokinase